MNVLVDIFHDFGVDYIAGTTMDAIGSENAVADYAAQNANLAEEEARLVAKIAQGIAKGILWRRAEFGENIYGLTD